MHYIEKTIIGALLGFALGTNIATMLSAIFFQENNSISIVYIFSIGAVFSFFGIYCISCVQNSTKVEDENAEKD